MLIPQKAINACEAHLNHLATELALSEIGTQNNLVPIYSLINAVVDCFKEVQALHASCLPIVQHFSKMLDEAKTFCEHDMALLSEFIEWTHEALEVMQLENPVVPFESHLGAAEQLAKEVLNEAKPPFSMPSDKPMMEIPVATSMAPLDQQNVLSPESSSSASQVTEPLSAPSAQWVEPQNMPLSAANVPLEVDTSLDVLLELNPAQDQELLQEFQTEANDHLEQIESNLLSIEKDPSNADTLNALFRSFHTMKGVSGFLKLIPVQRLAHEVESLMDHARKGKLVLNSGMITLILQAQDTMKGFIQQITQALESGVLPTEIIPVSHLIAEVKETIIIALSGTIQAAEAPIEIAFQAPQIPSGQENVVPEALPIPKPVEQATVANAPAATKAPFSKTQSPFAPTASVPGKTHAPFGKTHAPFEKNAPITDTATIRVNTTKLDSLMDVVGELVIIQSQLQESLQSAQGFADRQRGFSQLSRITKDLQRTSMSLRMVPIKPSFQKVSRMVRDLAKSSGKQVELHLFGEETELDRNVVEQIGDPLVHMIRNAIDHGIETPADRTKAGKDATGRIELKAYHMGSNIIIEMSDDGHGINAKKVHAKAISNGLIQAEDNLTEQDMVELIFAPGLSTAEKVTDISGRGVGMDVVKKNIEQMRGNVEVATTLGKGTTFKIKLPLTMAIIDGLIVGVGEDRFILPTNSVKIALKPTAESLSMLQGRTQLLHWRGQSIPVIQLHKHFQIPAKAQQATEGIVVILDIFGRNYGLLVDELVSKQEVVIKNLGNLLQSRPGIAGGAILGDGSIALILDPSGLCNQALRTPSTAGQANSNSSEALPATAAMGPLG
jgi:two-component system chemotaxis sensor kinase CheA